MIRNADEFWDWAQALRDELQKQYEKSMDRVKDELLKRFEEDFQKLLDEQAKPRRWRPVNEGMYWRRSGAMDQWLNYAQDIDAWQTDNVHRTKEEAERVNAMYQAWYKFRSMADWKEGIRYFAAIYNGEFDILFLSRVTGMPSFASPESCERAIEAAGRENLKAYLERQEWIWRDDA